VNEQVFTDKEAAAGMRGVLMTIIRLAEEGCERKDLDRMAVLSEIERMARHAQEFYTR
jgi:hypothetical protein